jgi:cytochrome c peroxidase
MVLTCAAGVAAALPAGADNGGAESRDAMKVELGRRLFFDPALGRRGRVGCADCHQPEKGFSDPRARSEDEERVLPRHSQPTLDLGGEGFHWDGEFPTVRDLIDARVLPAAAAKERADARFVTRVAAHEAASATGGRGSEQTPAVRSDGYGGRGFPITPSIAAKATPVAARLAEDRRYDEGFRLAYGDTAISAERIGDAVEAYLATLRTSENALDRFLAGRDEALTGAARRGLELFRGKANCSQCHAVDVKDGRAALTDGKFHDTGVGFNTRQGSGQAGTSGGGGGGGRGRGPRQSGPDLGRGGATLAEADNFSFKTPSLRDIARTSPYMHDASLATLADVVAYYDKGATPNPHLDARIKPLSLDAAERMDLVAFLESLSGDERAGLGSVPSYRRRSLALTVDDLEGRGMPKLRLRVVPCGDRLRGADEMPAPFDVTTAPDGTVSFEFPLSTHVRLESATHEIGLSRPIPDWVGSATLFATPVSVVSVRVKRAPGGAELPATIAARVLGLRVTTPGRGSTEPMNFTLTRALRLSADEAVYTTAPDRAGRVVVKMTDQLADLGAFEVDLAGGASETIDLGAAENVHPELPPEVLTQLVR